MAHKQPSTCVGIMMRGPRKGHVCGERIQGNGVLCETHSLATIGLPSAIRNSRLTCKQLGENLFVTLGENKFVVSPYSKLENSFENWRERHYVRKGVYLIGVSTGEDIRQPTNDEKEIATRLGIEIK